MTKVIKTVKQAIAAYNGERRFCRAFRVKAKDLRRWERGVPRGHALGLMLGLVLRGYAVSPELYGVASWKEIDGA